MQLQNFDFQGQSLPLIHINGQPAWLARDVGRLLGYSDDGRRIVTNIKEHWADELIEGTDLDVLEGDQLRDLKAVYRLIPKNGTSGERSDNPSIHPRTPSVTILYQSGLNLVCLLSKKPLGRALRRWLADEVLPALAEGRMPDSTSSSRPEHALKELRALAEVMLRADMKPEARRVLRLALDELEPAGAPRTKTKTPRNGGEQTPQPTQLQVNLSFDGLLPSAQEILKILAEGFLGEPPVTASLWVERFETVGLDRLVRASTPHAQATRAGLFLRKHVGTPVSVEERQVALGITRDWGATKAPLYGFSPIDDRADKLN